MKLRKGKKSKTEKSNPAECPTISIRIPNWAGNKAIEDNGNLKFVYVSMYGNFKFINL